MGKWAELHARGPHQPHPTPRHVDDVGGNAVMAWRRRPCPLLDAIDLLDGPSPSASPSQSPSPPPPASPPPLPPAPSSPPPKKRRLPDADADADAEDDGESDVVKALRAIGEGFLRAEQRRMEAARKTQQMRMEMALRHLDSQRRLMEALVDRIIDSLETSGV
uniref:Uncharacterized protein n=1 Tax=Oryza barthii TaxID=65489 RepID=A0A0D3FYJ1_9ORYZ